MLEYNLGLTPSHVTRVMVLWCPTIYDKLTIMTLLKSAVRFVNNFFHVWVRALS
jgi:hypothetical protein